MKKILWVVFVLLIITLPVVSQAATFRSGKQVSVGASEKIDDNLYIAGGTVSSAGPVTGDVLAAGGSVIISGDVGRDVAAAGGDVTIVSPVVGNVRAAGGNVLVENTVGGDLILAGGQITVGGSGVQGDTAIAGGSIEVDAPLAKTLRIHGNNVYINAPIAGNVTITAKKLTLGKGAVISGDLTYDAPQEMSKEDGAVVQGKLNFQQTKEAPAPAISPGVLAGLFTFMLIGKFLMLLVCALIVGLALKRYSTETVTRALARPFFEIGHGLVAFIVIPVISIILMATIIGIPLGALGFLGFAAMFIVSWIISPIVMGSATYAYFSKDAYQVNWKTILLGVVISAILGLIPLLGWLVQCLVFLMTFGAIIGFKMDMVKKWQ